MAFYDNFLNQFSSSVGSTCQIEKSGSTFCETKPKQIMLQRNTSFKIASCVSKFLRNRTYLLSITIKL